MKLKYNPYLRNSARELRKARNLSEALLWRELKGGKLGVRFLRQRPIGNYIVDFFCHELGLVLEIDGVSHNAKVERDVERQKNIEAKGLTFLRFLDNDVKNNLDGVSLIIKSSGLQPPPLRKEELREGII